MRTQVVRHQRRLQASIRELSEGRITLTHEGVTTVVRAYAMCGDRAAPNRAATGERRGRSPFASLMNTLTDPNAHPPHKLNTHYCSPKLNQLSNLRARYTSK